MKDYMNAHHRVRRRDYRADPTVCIVEWYRTLDVAGEREESQERRSAEAKPGMMENPNRAIPSNHAGPSQALSQVIL